MREHVRAGVDFEQVRARGWRDALVLANPIVWLVLGGAAVVAGVALVGASLG